MNLKKLFVSLLLLCAAFSLCAVQTMTVKWQWDLNDPDVRQYRYQLDGTKDNAWTVVSGRTNSYEATGLDPYVDHTLYLQSSYNGVDWSETAASTAKALLDVRPEVPQIKAQETPTTQNRTATPSTAPNKTSDTKEATVASTEEPKEEATEVAASPEEKVAEEKPAKAPKAPKEKKPKKESAKYPFSFGPYINVGVATNFYTVPKVELEGVFTEYSAGLEVQNIYSAGPWGFGLRVGADVIIEPYEQTWASIKGMGFTEFFAPDTWFYDSTYLGMLMMYFGTQKFDFYLGGGFGYSLFNPRLNGVYSEAYGHTFGDVGTKFSSALVVPAVLGLRYQFVEHLKLGLEANIRFLLPAQKLTGSANVSFYVPFS